MKVYENCKTAGKTCGPVRNSVTIEATLTCRCTVPESSLPHCDTLEPPGLAQLWILLSKTWAGPETAFETASR